MRTEITKQEIVDLINRKEGEGVNLANSVIKVPDDRYLFPFYVSPDGSYCCGIKIARGDKFDICEL